MYHCKRCEAEFRDGVQCTSCQGHFDFQCAGITEAGYRKLGERKNNWKCTTCKAARSASPLQIPSSVVGAAQSPTPADMDSIVLELKRLSSQMSTLPALTESLKSIQADINDLKTLKADIADLKLIKPDLADMKASMEFVHQSVEALTDRVAAIDRELQDLRNTKDNVSSLQQEVGQLRGLIQEQEQRSRMNNIEIKGVPMAANENLYSVVSKIGELVKCPLSRDQINFIARIPMRNDKLNKNIIVSVHNRYLKEDYVAAAKKRTITPCDLGLQGDTRIFVNDHLTLENKLLLNKTKELAKERNFSFTWVKACKIFIRKNPTSPVITIKSEADLKRISN